MAEYLPEINLSSDPEKKKPVDISWLKAFAQEREGPQNNNQANSFLPLSTQQAQTEHSLLKKLTHRTAQSSPYSLWEPLSPLEENIAKWLLHHLDKKELIHWLIKQAPIQTGLISLHPKFKDMLKWNLKHIQENSNEKLDERKFLFWEIITTQEEHFNKPDTANSFIYQLNKKGYSYARTKELLSCLKPQIGFKTHFFIKELNYPDLIYEPKLTINAFDNSSSHLLKDEKSLLCHAEVWTDFLKKGVELAEWAGLTQNGENLFYIPSLLITLARDSFDLAMEKDKKLAKFLLNKWQMYPYSVFYRLVLYAVTKHSDIEEKVVIKLFEEKPDQTLWSIICQKEVLSYLSNRQHSKEDVKKLLSLIMKGPDRSLYSTDIDEEFFIEQKKRQIYKRLNCLKDSKIQLPADIETYYNQIQSKYNIPKTRENSDGFSVSHKRVRRFVFEKRYHNMTNEQIFEDIKSTDSNTGGFLDEKVEDFQAFLKESHDRAFKILSMFPDNDMNSTPYWGAFINEVSMMTDAEESRQWSLQVFEKIEYFNDSFVKKCLSSLIHILNMKDSLIYPKDKGFFKKWWDRLWNLSIKEKYNNDSDISFSAFNSHLGKLSQSIFYVLWSNFPDGKIKENGKIPEDIKKYFKSILRPKVIKKDPAILFHFGSYLSQLWYLDREWTIENLKPLIDWKKIESVLVRKTTDLLAYSFQSNSNPPEGTEDTIQDCKICKPLWRGYLFYNMFLGPDFLEDFKEEFFQLILNYKQILNNSSKSHKIEYLSGVATIFFVTTGGREIQNIFTEGETDQLIHKVGKDILELISCNNIWKSLEDSEKDKSAVLWFEKIKPWIEKFWPKQKNKRSAKIAEHLSFAILHCGNQLPEAFKVLKDQIEGVITQNSTFMGYHIIDQIGLGESSNTLSSETENLQNKQMKKSPNKLIHIFDYPNELLQLLNWNFPEDKIHYNYNEQIKRILDQLKSKHPDIEKNEHYKKLIDKIN